MHAQCTVCILQIINTGKVCSFCGSIGNHKTFPVKCEACGIGSGYEILTYNPESFPVLLYITKVFHLKQFAMYGISMEPACAIMLCMGLTKIPDFPNQFFHLTELLDLY